MITKVGEDILQDNVTINNLLSTFSELYPPFTKRQRDYEKCEIHKHPLRCIQYAYMTSSLIRCPSLFKVMATWMWFVSSCFLLFNSLVKSFKDHYVLTASFTFWAPWIDRRHRWICEIKLTVLRTLHRSPLTCVCNFINKLDSLCMLVYVLRFQYHLGTGPSTWVFHERTFLLGGQRMSLKIPNHSG